MGNAIQYKYNAPNNWHISLNWRMPLFSVRSIAAMRAKRTRPFLIIEQNVSSKITIRYGIIYLRYLCADFDMQIFGLTFFLRYEEECKKHVNDMNTEANLMITYYRNIHIRWCYLIFQAAAMLPYSNDPPPLPFIQ